MKRLLHIIIVAGMLLAGSVQISALDLINTAKPEKIIGIGVRVGFNSSNLSNNFSDQFPEIVSQKQQWRNGFSVGAVVDLNMTGFLTIQPGLFLSTRKNDYNMILNNAETSRYEIYNGSANCKYLTVPIMASFRMGVAELIQLQVDLGPYMAWGFGGKNKYTLYGYKTNPMTNALEPWNPHAKSAYFGNGGLAKRYDYGLKTGVGILAMGKVYLGAHFMYGCRNALQEIPLSAKSVKGHNKRWEFTIGYNL
ncbi:MAG: PorT family protein [Muribaculaceae bacterium]|nr:PorT family protein [Muribaculaceae bacterium]